MSGYRDTSSNSNSSSRSASTEGKKKKKKKSKNKDNSNQNGLNTSRGSSSSRPEPSSSSKSPGSSRPQQSEDTRGDSGPSQRARSSSTGSFHDRSGGVNSDRNFEPYHENSRNSEDYSFNQNQWSYNQNRGQWNPDYSWNSGNRNWNQNWYGDQDYRNYESDFNKWQSDGNFPRFNPNKPPPPPMRGWNMRGRGRGATRGGWRGGEGRGAEWEQKNYHSSDEHNANVGVESPRRKGTSSSKGSTGDDMSKGESSSSGLSNNLSLKASKIIDDIMKGGTGKDLVSKEVPTSDPKPRKADASSGNTLIDKAENLCKELRMKRQLGERERERKEKRDQERKKWDDHLRDKHIHSSPNRPVPRRNSSKDSTRVSFSDDVSSPNTPDITTVQRLATHSKSPQPGKSVSSVMAPNISRARRVSEPSDKQQDNQDNNILKLINSPRSRRERMEVARILTKYGKVIQHKKRPKLNLNNEAVPGDVEGEVLQLDELPDELRQEIAQLMENEEIEEGTALQIPGHPASEMSLYDIINQHKSPPKASTPIEKPSETPSTSYNSVAQTLWDRPRNQEFLSHIAPSVSSITGAASSDYVSSRSRTATMDTTTSVSTIHAGDGDHLLSRSRTVTMDTTPAAASSSSLRYPDTLDLTSPERRPLPPTSVATSSPIVIQDKDDDEPSTTKDSEDDCMVVEQPRSPARYPPPAPRLSPRISTLPSAIVIQPEGTGMDPYSHQPYMSYHDAMLYGGASPAAYHGSPHLDYYPSPLRTDSLDTDRSGLNVDDLDTSGGLAGGGGGSGHGGEIMDHSSQEDMGRSSPGNKRRRTASNTVSVI